MPFYNIYYAVWSAYIVLVVLAPFIICYNLSNFDVWVDLGNVGLLAFSGFTGRPSGSGGPSEPGSASSSSGPSSPFQSHTVSYNVSPNQSPIIHNNPTQTLSPVNNNYNNPTNIFHFHFPESVYKGVSHDSGVQVTGVKTTLGQYGRWTIEKVAQIFKLSPTMIGLLQKVPLGSLSAVIALVGSGGLIYYYVTGPFSHDVISSQQPVVASKADLQRMLFEGGNHFSEIIKKPLGNSDYIRGNVSKWHDSILQPKDLAEQRLKLAYIRGLEQIMEEVQSIKPTGLITSKAPQLDLNKVDTDSLLGKALAKTNEVPNPSVLIRKNLTANSKLSITDKPTPNKLSVELTSDGVKVQPTDTEMDPELFYMIINNAKALFKKALDS